MPPLYMGPSSSFAGAFGKPGTPRFNFGAPDVQIGANPDAPREGPVGNTPLVPQYSGLPAQTSVPTKPGNVLGPQAIRASGPSQGFDPSYLQNLATAIGGLFSGNRTGNTTSFNPLGNLSEISGSSGMEGNAPQQGLPLTWLQQALNGLGFNWQPSAPPAPPRIGGGGVGGGGGNRGGPGGGRPLLQ